jgi:hypothetical protein
MTNFGVRITFLLPGTSKQDIAQQVTEFMQAGTDGSGVEVNMAAIEINSLPADMGGDLQENPGRSRCTEAERAARIRGARNS